MTGRKPYIDDGSKGINLPPGQQIPPFPGTDKPFLSVNADDMITIEWMGEPLLVRVASTGGCVLARLTPDELNALADLQDRSMP